MHDDVDDNGDDDVNDDADYDSEDDVDGIDDDEGDDMTALIMLMKTVITVLIF